MSKFESILSDAEIVDIVSGLTWSSGDTLGFGKEVAEHVEQATLAKRHEQQEPVFYISDKVLNNKTGKIDSTVKNALTWSRNKCQSWSVPLYVHPKPVLDQKPFAWFIDDKRVCGNKIVTDPEVAKDWLGMDIYKVVPLYARPTPKVDIEPVFWVRFVSDGEGWESPIHHSGMTSEMIESGRYTPLYAHPMPVLEQEPVAWRHSLKMECDQQIVKFTENANETPHGKPELDYSPEYHVEITPLYEHPFQIKGLADGTPIDEGTKEHHRTAKNSLEQEVLCMVRMLEDREWADHAGQSDLGKRLEVAISTLHNELYEAQVKRSKPELARNQSCGCVVCHCENQDQCQGCGAKNCGTHEVGEIPNPIYADHIPDSRNMVGKKINMSELEDLVFNEMDRRFGLRGEKNQYERLPIDDTQLGVEFALQCMAKLMCESDHTSDPKKIIDLSLSIDTKEAQTLLQSYLDDLKDWQLVPRDISYDMRRAVYFSTGIATMSELMPVLWEGLLDSAPKYTGNNDD